MFGKKSRLILSITFLLVVVLLFSSCYMTFEVFVKIINEHTGTIFFSVLNASGDPNKLYDEKPMQPGGTTTVTLEYANGYYLQFFANIGGLNHIWKEEIGGVETQNIPWVSGKTYYIGDPGKGNWELIM